MRILIYGINFSPELTSTGKYTGELAMWLANRGHDVRVITAPPYYPEWRVQFGYSKWFWKREDSAKVSVRRCPLWVPKNPSGLKRILHLLSFALSSAPVALAQIIWRPNLVWTVEPALACAPLALLVGRLSGGATWLHIQDFEVDAAFEMGLLRGEYGRRLILNFERWLMCSFDRVSTISDRMLDRARGKGVLPERLVRFPNWVDISLIQYVSRSVYRDRLRLRDSDVVALYSGNMGNKQGLEVLAEAARSLIWRKDLVFVFCGEGSGRAALEEACDGLENVRFLPLQPLDQLSQLLGLADIHLLPQRADAADLVMPSKLSGMLASGRCVLATANPGTELASVVAERARCGLVVPPENVDAFVAGLLRLTDDSERRWAMGAAGRDYAEKYIETNSILSAFERCAVDLVKLPRAS